MNTDHQPFFSYLANYISDNLKPERKVFIKNFFWKKELANRLSIFSICSGVNNTSRRSSLTIGRKTSNDILVLRKFIHKENHNIKKLKANTHTYINSISHGNSLLNDLYAFINNEASMFYHDEYWIWFIEQIIITLSQDTPTAEKRDTEYTKKLFSALRHQASSNYTELIKKLNQDTAI